MCELKVGDTVKSYDGLLGTVAVICGLHGHVGVVHNDRNGMFHNLGGSCKPGYGWWYLPSKLTKVSVFKGNIK